MSGEPGGTTQRLRRLRADDGYERWARRADPPLLVLAVLFVAVLVVPLVTTVRSPYDVLLAAASVLIWLVFALDYVIRLYLAPDRRRYVRTHLVDLAVVLIPMLRPLRGLALLRAVPVGSAAVMAHQKATLHARVTGYVLSAVVVALLVGGVAVHEAERRSPDATIDSVGQGIWWAVVTVTTVGYGDEHPVTLGGRIVAVVLMLVGIALIGVVTGAIATWFVDRLKDEDRQADQVAEERVEATLDDVLAELRAIRDRLDALEGGSTTRPATPDPGECSP